MYRYEELDYNQIRNDSEIDPNSGDAYYALAQCCRLGKGIAPDMEMYEEYLGYAAEEGHEMAARELASLEQGVAGQDKTGMAAPASQSVGGQTTFRQNAVPVQDMAVATRAEVDYASMTVAELRRSADAGSAEAAFRLYTVSKNIGDSKNASAYLKMAGESAVQNGVEKMAGQKIFWALGELYKQGKDKDLQESLHAYEMAAEMGSVQACNYLSDCYRHGNGGVAAKDFQQAERYRRMAARNGNAADRYRLAEIYMKENENLIAMELLEQVMAEVGPSDDLHLLSRIQLSRMNASMYPREALVEVLWEKADQTNNQKLAKEAKAELLVLYKAGPEEKGLSKAAYAALNPDRAYLFGTWRKGADPTAAKRWFVWASAGNEQAKAALAELEAMEVERQRQKAIEDEAKREEAAALAEKKRQENIAREEQRKKEAAEKAERERLAVIEAEKRRQAEEEQKRLERIEAEARALVLKEERERERQRKKEEAARLAEEKRIREEEERKRREIERARQERLAQANKQLQETYCKEESRLYVGRFVKYLVISIVWAIVGFFAAVFTFSYSSGAHSFCQTINTLGTLAWGCLSYRMGSCMRAIEECYPGKFNHRQIRNHLGLQRTLMWPVGLVWIINGILAQDIGWISFFAGALGILLQWALICWIVNKVYGRFFLNKVFDWIRCKNEIINRRGEVLDIF